MMYKLPSIIPNLNIDLKYVRQKKDPVLDTPDEIKKWLIERQKRFPRRNKPNEDHKPELSILEQKLRKKIQLLSGSARRAQMKAKQIKDLCKTITDNKRPKDDQHYQIKQEIQALEQQLQQQKPREFYRLKGQGVEIEEMSKTDKKKIKLKIKELKQRMNVQKEVPLEKIDHNQDILEKLEQQQKNVKQLLDDSMNYKFNPANYKYKSNTLFASLIVDDIYKERQYLLQAFRYLVKENFFEPIPEIFEKMTSEEEEQILSSSSEDEEISSQTDI